jgi:hypothetical protein
VTIEGFEFGAQELEISCGASQTVLCPYRGRCGETQRILLMSATLEDILQEDDNLEDEFLSELNSLRQEVPDTAEKIPNHTSNSFQPLKPQVCTYVISVRM